MTFDGYFGREDRENYVLWMGLGSVMMSGIE
jgi:hypothetical protein